VGSRSVPDNESSEAGGLGEAATAFVSATPEGTKPPALVAIGTSAGGLEALEQFFAAVEAPSRFAFVLVQHLSAELQSLLVELLTKRTALAVRAVEDGTIPAADAIHLVPPERTMTLEAGRFRLAERDPRALVHHPIDAFFVSLAADRGPAAVGIVLSGSGSDGSRGARAIRAAGGRVLVQEPKTATFSSMPAAAIAAGCDAEVMPPAAMAEALLQTGQRRAADPEIAGGLSPDLAACLEQVFAIDVAAYRTAPLQHGVHRRMLRRGFDRLDAYTAVVVDDADEQEALFQELLIGTTGFLRDASGLAALEREVVPALAARLDAGEEVRIWVAGCATGEEAYAIAMLLLAQCRAPLDSLPLSIFATDIHRRSLAVAGAGFYSEEASADLRPDWCRRFFTRRGSGWQVDQAVRQTITFSPHDLLREPPFPSLQLISCRNLVRYLQPAAGDRLIASFAASLLPGGHLLLGEGELADLPEAFFARLDPGLPLYRRKRDAAQRERGSLVAGALPPPGPPLTVSPGRVQARERRDQRLTTARELLLDRYAPPSLLVDEAGQVIHCFGDAGRYLETPRGRPSLAVLDMVKDVLRAPLAAAINRVKRTGQPATLAGLPLAEGPDAPLLPRLVVEAPSGRPDARRCLLVSFDDRPTAAAGPAAGDDAEASVGLQPGLDRATLRRLDELERDLRFGEETLKETIRALEATNAALDARNQELEATAEATNASLQALRTSGIEQQRRIEILVALGQELERLVEATGLAAVLLDPALAIRRFTPAATRYFNLLPHDVGRPLGHVTHHFAATDIVALLQASAAGGASAVHDLETTAGSPVRLTLDPIGTLGETLAGIAIAVHERDPAPPPVRP